MALNTFAFAGANWSDPDLRDGRYVEAIVEAIRYKTAMTGSAVSSALLKTYPPVTENKGSFWRHGLVTEILAELKILAPQYYNQKCSIIEYYDGGHLTRGVDEDYYNNYRMVLICEAIDPRYFEFQFQEKYTWLTACEDTLRLGGVSPDALGIAGNAILPTGQLKKFIYFCYAMLNKVLIYPKEFKRMVTFGITNVPEDSYINMRNIDGWSQIANPSFFCSVADCPDPNGYTEMDAMLTAWGNNDYSYYSFGALQGNYNVPCNLYGEGCQGTYGINNGNLPNGYSSSPMTSDFLAGVGVRVNLATKQSEQCNPLGCNINEYPIYFPADCYEPYYYTYYWLGMINAWVMHINSNGTSDDATCWYIGWDCGTLWDYQNQFLFEMIRTGSNSNTFEIVYRTTANVKDYVGTTLIQDFTPTGDCVIHKFDGLEYNVGTGEYDIVTSGTVAIPKQDDTLVEWGYQGKIPMGDIIETADGACENLIDENGDWPDDLPDGRYSRKSPGHKYQATFNKVQTLRYDHNYRIDQWNDLPPGYKTELFTNI
jgi:hypothetical protein